MTKYTAKIRFSIKAIPLIFKYCIGMIKKDSVMCIGAIDEMVDKNIITFKKEGTE